MADNQSETGDQYRDESRSSTELGKLARGISGLAAAGAGAAGIIGVFAEGTNTGGVPVLLVLAAFFGYLAVSGQRLTRLKIGDNEAAFDRVVNVVTQRVLEDPAVPAEAKGDVAEAVGEVQPALAPRTRRLLGATRDRQFQAAAYDLAVRSAVKVLASGMPDLSMVEDESDDGLLLRGPGDTTLRLETTYWDGEVTADFVAMLFRSKIATGPAGATLLVTNAPIRSDDGTSTPDYRGPTIATPDYLRPTLAITTWIPGDDIAKLRNAIEMNLVR